MPKRKQPRSSAQTANKRPVKKAKTKSTKCARKKSSVAAQSRSPQAHYVDPRTTMLEAMSSIGYDGTHFADHLQLKCTNMQRVGKPPRRIRFIQYCSWAYALLGKEIGPEESEYQYPDMVLAYIRHLVPGDIKGEIREAAFPVPLKDFCEALELPKV